MFELRQYFILLLTATIWGTGFIGQKLGMDHISPFAFTFLRTFIGGLFLIPVILVLKNMKYKNKPMLRPSKPRKFIVGSIACGICLITAESFQQFGLVYTDVNKASFVTALYIIFVPFIGLALGSKIQPKIIVALLVSVVGLYLLCMKGSFILQMGDFLVLIGAMCFAFHIMVISHYVNYVDGVLLSCGQFFVASFLGLIMMLITGVPSYEAFVLAAPAFIYTGIMSNGIAYTLQVIGQRGINSSIASLIMSLESVMGAIFAVLLLDESMSTKEVIGAILMFVAVIIAQLPSKKAK
jgi:drug/metabolite transporter (DMT)-like permease